MRCVTALSVLAALILQVSCDCPTLQCPDGCHKTTGNKGCDACVCPSQPRCPKLTCPKSCEKVAGDNGCDACHCSVSRRCPLLTCPSHCDSKSNEHGCSTCTCAYPPSCSRLWCPSWCSKTTDDKGCTKCSCSMKRRGKCVHMRCPSATTETDDQGCTACVFQAKPKCPTVTCSGAFKKVTGETGCDACVYEGEKACVTLTCPASCDKVKGEDGCDACMCKSKPSCPRLTCPARCDKEKGDNGCDQCVCHAVKRSTADTLSCPDKCTMSADQGCICEARSVCAYVDCPYSCVMEEGADGCKQCLCPGSSLQGVPCEKAVKQAEGKQAEHIPTCNKRYPERYVSRQCSNGTCWCVSVWTGHRFTQPVPRSNRTQLHCLQMQTSCNKVRNLSKTQHVDYKPACNAHYPNRFLSRQCAGEECWCVSVWTGQRLTSPVARAQRLSLHCLKVQPTVPKTKE